MKKILDFLGQCHNPNSVRGAEVNDRIAVVIEDTSYNYALGCDPEEVAEHCLKMHFENSKETIEEDVIYSVREQLGLNFEIVEELPISKKVIKKPAKKAKKSVKSKAKKKS